MTINFTTVILTKFALAALFVLGSTGCAANHSLTAAGALRPTFGAANGGLTENFTLAHSVRPEPIVRSRDRGPEHQTTSTQSAAPVAHHNNIPL